MSDLLTIGIRGLMSYQAALTVASQNMMNFDTPFYSRREVNFAEALFNSGVDIADVRRIYSSYASDTLQRATSNFAMSDALADQLMQLEKSLGDDKSSVGASIMETLKTLRELNNNVGSSRSRNDYLNMLTILSSRISTSANQINDKQNNINHSIQSIVGDINLIATQIAELNQKIANSNGLDTASLLDQREAQIQELAKYVDFSTDVDDTGQINVMLGNGTPLVFGNEHAKFSTETDPSDPTKLVLKLTSGSSATAIDVTHLIKGGQLAGLFSTQAILDQAINSLGRLAITVANSLNEQNKLGLDLNGNWGGNIFKDINTTSLMANRSIGNLGNTGTENITVTITDPNLLDINDYKLTFTSATDYTVTRVSDNSVVTTGTVGALPHTISMSGFDITLNSGSIVANDSFLISPTRGAAEGMGMFITDPTQLALAWAVNAQPNQQNKGTGQANVTAILDPSNSAFSIPQQLNPPIRVEFISATSYQLVNATTDVVMEGPLTYDPLLGGDIFPTPGGYDPGYRVRLSGSISTGDSFNIDYTSMMTSDNRNGLAMEVLYENKSMQNGTLTFLEGYNLMASNISLKTKAERINVSSNEVLQKQAYAQFQQISGVNQQEEVANLTRYHEAYQASAQIIQVAKEIFDTIIALGRG